MQNAKMRPHFNFITTPFYYGAIEQLRLRVIGDDWKVEATLAKQEDLEKCAKLAMEALRSNER
jgi:hypothetical protein